MADLHLITLPIGNIRDLTPRAFEVLGAQREFYAEDTRAFKTLLGHLELPVVEYRIRSFHDQSQEQASRLIRVLDEGRDLFYVSEAGSPVISDPAYPIICQVLKKGHGIKTYPGVSAPIAALELSGLPPHPFTFYGFLPREEKKKEELFLGLKEKHTHIFFEGTARVGKTLELLERVLPEISVSLCRELTKKFEQVERFKAKEWSSKRDRVPLKGEFVLLLYSREGLSSFRRERVYSAEKAYHLAKEYVDRPTPKGLAKLLGALLDQDVNRLYLQLGKKHKKNS